MQGGGHRPKAASFSSPWPKMSSHETEVRVSKWFCDKCNVAHFDDYTEACIHESKCNGIPLEQFAHMTRRPSPITIPTPLRHPQGASKPPLARSNHEDDSSNDELECQAQAISVKTRSMGLPLTPPIRHSLNGIWLLDKTLSSSLRGYLQTMSISPDLISRHLELEQSKTTVNDITLTKRGYSLKHFLLETVEEAQVFESTLHQSETILISRPKEAVQRKKTTWVQSRGMECVEVTCRIDTIHGFRAVVTDTKSLQTVEMYNDGRGKEQEVLCTWLPQESTLMKHELKVVNEGTGEKHTTTRYFVPFDYPKGGDLNGGDGDS